MRNVSGRSAIPITQVATKLEAGGTSQGGGEGDEVAAVVAFDHILVLLWIASILRKTAPGQKTGREDLALRFRVSHASFPAEENLAAGGYGVVELGDGDPLCVCREELREVSPLSLIS